MDNKELETLANQLRFTAVDMVYRAKDGHPGPALSIADIMTVLYFDEMRLDPKNPDWEDRDRFILSKGHACPIWYACLSERGYFGEKVDDFHLRALHLSLIHISIRCFIRLYIRKSGFGRWAGNEWG